MSRGHWLLQVAQRAGLGGADTVDVAPSTPAVEAWHSVAAACSVPEGDLVRHVADHYHLRIADLFAAEPRVVKLVPEDLARRFNVFPLGEDDRHLVVATADPNDFHAEQALGFASGRTPVFAVAAPSQLREAIDGAYSPGRALETLLGRVDAESEASIRVLEEERPEQVGTEAVTAAPVVKLTNLILRDAVVHRASDIHMEPGRNGGTVRFRVDGVMHQYMQLPMPALNRVVSRVKILGKLDIADRVRPQDGRARVAIAGHTYDLRISTVPTRDAEKAVIRILDPESSITLEDLALAEPEMCRFRQLLSHRDGIVIVTGPTGSGKTTTMYAAIRELATGEVNIMTVEDPVEYELPGITQIQVEHRRGVTFASSLRAILRQDPDVIFVGEIRDAETAEVAVQAAMTGHLVLATLHTNDAVGVVQRLADLGLDRAAIAATVRGALAQRLVRRVCEHCGSGAHAEDVVAAPSTASGGGCDECGKTGYRGRLPIAEVIVADAALSDAIAKGATLADLTDAARRCGMRSIGEAAVDQVHAGKTTQAEVERALGRSPDRVSVADAVPDQILVVDDDTVSRTMARALLEKSGYRVTEAEDGIQALEAVSNGTRYALMVLDLDMPRLGGQAVLAQLRSSLSNAGMPVVVLTGSSDPNTEITLMEIGADDYIRKPLDPPRFIARVKAALRRAGAA